MKNSQFTLVWMTILFLIPFTLVNAKNISIQDISIKQASLSCGIGNFNEPILCIIVNTQGESGDCFLNNLQIQLTGKSPLTDVTKIKAYSTGHINRFHVENALFLGSITPSLEKSTLSFNTPISLQKGTSYIWITFDISKKATEGNILDIQLLGYTVNNKSVSHTQTNALYETTILKGNAALFYPGDDGSLFYRIPAIVTANDGSIVIAADRRNKNNWDLPGDIDVMIRRSTDNGKTWSEPLMIAGKNSELGYGDPALVIEKKSGKIICLFAGHQGFFNSKPDDLIRIYQSDSHDNGITWSIPKDITNQIYGPECSDTKSQKWLGAFIASGRALQMRNGRLLFALAVREEGQGINNYIGYSDDNGETWHPSTNIVCKDGDESKLVERNNGDLLISIRNAGSRDMNISKDKGLTWGKLYNNPQLKDPNCNGEILTYTSTADGFKKNRMLHSLCYSSNRDHVSVLLSYDEGDTWPIRKIINERSSGYSTLTILQDGSIGCFFEDESIGEGYTLRFVRFSLNWLTNGKDSFQ